MGVETILREFGAAPAQSMVVGDSEVDVQTARNAGAWACGRNIRFRQPSPGRISPDILVDSLTELLPHLSCSPAR